MNQNSNVPSFPETEIPPNYSEVSPKGSRCTNNKSNDYASNSDW